MIVRTTGAWLAASLAAAVVAAPWLVGSAAAPRVGASHPSSAAAPMRTPHAWLVPHGVDRDALRAVAARVESTLARVDRLVGGPVAGPPPRALRVHVYATLETKGLATGSTRPAHTDGRALHVSAEGAVPGDVEFVVARRRLARWLGPARRTVIDEGMAMRCVPAWAGAGWPAWSRRLARVAAGDVPLGRLLDEPAYAALSPLLRRPLAAELAASVERWYGTAVLRAMRAGRAPPPGLETRWAARVRELADVAPACDGAPARRLPRFVRGLCFAHEGYAIRDGYVSRAADRALRRARDLGANAVAITPFTYMRDPHAPAPLPRVVHPGAETDEAVLHAARSAHALGMAVMIKPHVWLGRSWPGEIAMRTPADWDAFFKAYEEWILHYAVLAEVAGAEALCVGTEMVHATAGHAERWRAIASRIRCVFDGELTYAANWGEEFERFDFWDAFDLAGIDGYYPLSGDSAADDATLRAGADSVLARIEATARRAGTRVVFTELGYPALPAAWVRPWAGVHHGARAGAAADPQAQARAWAAMLDAVAASLDRGDRVLAGLFVWKWPSFLEDGGPRHAGYTPNGKAAESIIRRAFRRRLP